MVYVHSSSLPLFWNPVYQIFNKKEKDPTCFEPC